MSPKTLIVERRDAVTLIRLNRPDALNALNAELMDELTAALTPPRPIRACAAW